MSDVGWVLDSLPSGVFTALAAVSGLAFLAGPLALATFGPRGWRGGLQQLHARLPAATFLSLLSLTAASVTGTACLVQVFLGIAATGSGGAGIVAEAGVAATRPVLYGVVTLAACLLGVATLTLLRADGERRPHAAERAPMSLWLAVGLAMLLGLAIVAADGLLRLHHELMNVTMTLIDPARRADAVGAGLTGSASAAIIGRDSSMLILGGGVLSLALMVAGLATWRASRARRPHRLLVWASTVALVIVVVGAAWHARLVRATLESNRDVARRVVRLEKIQLFNQTNVELGYRALAIHSPREVTTDEEEDTN